MVTLKPASELSPEEAAAALTPEACRQRFAAISSAASPKVALRGGSTTLGGGGTDTIASPATAYQRVVAARYAMAEHVDVPEELTAGMHSHDASGHCGPGRPIKPVNELVQGEFQLHFYRQYVAAPTTLPSLAPNEDTGVDTAASRSGRCAGGGSTSSGTGGIAQATDATDEEGIDSVSGGESHVAASRRAIRHGGVAQRAASANGSKSSHAPTAGSSAQSRGGVAIEEEGGDDDAEATLPLTREQILASLGVLGCVTAGVAPAMLGSGDTQSTVPRVGDERGSNEAGAEDVDVAVSLTITDVTTTSITQTGNGYTRTTVSAESVSTDISLLD